jgi:hypothetical protein
MPQGATEIDSMLAAQGTPLLYRQNAFRLTGLPVTASSREIARFLEKLTVQERLGAPAQAPGGLLPLDPVPEITTIRETVQAIQKDPETRLLHEFFWIWPLSQDGESTLSTAGSSNSDAVLDSELWKALSDKGGAQAFIARHNLAVWHHAQLLDGEWEADQGISHNPRRQSERNRLWEETLTTWNSVQADARTWEWMVGRVQTINDPRLTFEAVERLREQLPLVLCLISATLAVQAARRGTGTEAAQYLTRLTTTSSDSDLRERAILSVLQLMREKISAICQRSDETYKHEPDRGSQIVSALLEDARPLVEVIHDQVATKGLELLIAYGKKTEEWAACELLLEQCLGVARGEMIRNRLCENLQTVKNLKTENCCWVCGINKTDQSFPKTVKLYNNIRGSGSFVQWDRKEVMFPSCLSCARMFQEMKMKADRVGTWSWIIASIISFPTMCYAILPWLDPAESFGERVSWSGLSSFFFGALVSLVAAVFSETVGENSYWRSHGHSTARLEEYPLVQQLLKDGWKMGAKPPNV